MKTQLGGRRQTSKQTNTVINAMPNAIRDESHNRGVLPGSAEQVILGLEAP